MYDILTGGDMLIPKKIYRPIPDNRLPLERMLKVLVINDFQGGNTNDIKLMDIHYTSFKK
jgi:hypothetical protein